jgi:hypothetical protein
MYSIPAMNNSYSTIFVHPKYIIGAPGTYVATNNGNFGTSAGIVHVTADNVNSQMFYAHGNPEHYLCANSCAYLVINNGYLGTNGGNVHSHICNSNVNLVHNPSGNSSTYSVMNNGYLCTNNSQG